jgi:ABC-type multidrug transport system fused ATPase/permease subunit
MSGTSTPRSRRLKQGRKLGQPAKRTSYGSKAKLNDVKIKQNITADVYLAGLYKAHQAKQPYKELHEFPYSLYGCEHTNRMDQICGRSSETTEPAPSVCDEKKLTSQDFPSELDNSDALSDLNLSRFQDKSDQIDKYLREKQPFTNDIIVLPNICYTESIRYERFKRFTDNPNQLDQFKFIKMINRKSIVDELFNNIKENDSCMVYGPQGCGKSFVVYQLACRLIQCGYFVVYINKTDVKLKSSIVRILNAKLKSIGVSIEKIFKKNLETIEEDTNLVLRLIKNAKRILLEKKKPKANFRDRSSQ